MKENKEEIWKDVVGYESKYQVSNFGYIKRLEKKALPVRGHGHKPERILKLTLDGNGYYAVKLYGEKTTKKMFRIHRLIAVAFIPNPLDNPFINHINGIRNDNRVENLEWVTNRENNRHGITNLSEKTHHSRFSGVSAISDKNSPKKWRAFICINKKYIHLGHFKEERSAALSYLNYLQKNGLSTKYIFNKNQKYLTS